MVDRWEKRFIKKKGNLILFNLTLYSIMAMQKVIPCDSNDWNKILEIPIVERVHLMIYKHSHPVVSSILNFTLQTILRLNI